MKFAELMRGIEGVGVVSGGEVEVSGVSEDSRKVRAGDVFVARGGTKVSGAAYVTDAIKKGAVAIVGEFQNSEFRIQNSVGFAQVTDAGLALAVMAHRMVGNPTAGMKMIGVTGTKGKTTVAYLLRSVLKAAGHKVGMVGTVEIDDGAKDGGGVVPAEMTTPGVVELVELFGRMKKNGVTHCVMEVSSHALHQHRVAGIEFAVGIFTNLTGDHLDYHGTMKKYAAAKAILFEGLKPDAVAVVNADDKWAERIIQGCRARIFSYRVASRPKVGPGVIHPFELPSIPGDSPHSRPSAVPVLPDAVPPGGFAGYIWRMSSRGMGLTVCWDELSTGQSAGGQSIVTPLVGRHNCYNITSVFAAAKLLNALDARDIKTRVELIKVWRKAAGAPGRLQRVEAETLFSVFVDYAHTHDALENVLTALRTTMGDAPKGGTTNGRLICMFGCGGDRDRTKRPKMGKVAEKLADVVIVTSDNPRTEEPGAIIEEICAGFSKGWKSAGKITIEPDRREAIQMAIGMAKAGDVVLLAGKGHENYQIIGTTKHHFDDVEEAQMAMGRKSATNEHK